MAPVPRHPAARPPTGGPLAEHLLTDGDLLYVPRGWWHVAAAVGEPSLHLTFGISPATGIDLLAWVADGLRAEVDFRRDLPRFAGRAEREAHVAALGRLLAAAWTPEVLDRFLADRAAAAGPRPRFGLPWSATAAVLPPGDGALVRVLTPRAVLGQGQDGTVELLAAGRRLTFARAAEPLLAALLGGRPRTLGELAALPGHDLDAATVRALVAELVVQGLVAVDGVDAGGA